VALAGTHAPGVMTGVAVLPSHPPPIGSLLAGFVIMAIGLAALTYRRSHVVLKSAAGTRRALSIVAIYAVCSVWFMRVLAPAVLGLEQSPWLEALGDVICVTLGLFVWVVALSEHHDRRDYGLHGAPPARFLVALLMGLGAVGVCGFWSYRRVFMGQASFETNHLVFALTYAVLGTAIPDELLFRGLFMTSLEGRTSRWFRVAAPAILFTLVRGFRLMPGTDLPTGMWLGWLFGTVLPLGLWWGLMRDLAGGSLWPGLLSHAVLEFGTRLAGAPLYGHSP
jgi:membrane protease YdiL (CAAX protease family)